MLSNNKKLIAVIGATGQQGGGVVHALQANGAFKVRALTRIATPETEARLLAVVRAGTAVHVESIVRGWRRLDHQADAREATDAKAWPTP